MADPNLPAGFPTNLTDFESFERFLQAERRKRQTEQAADSDRRLREQEHQEWREQVFRFGPGAGARMAARKALDEEKFSAYQAIQGELQREERVLKQRHQQEVEALRARYQEKTTKSEQSYTAKAAALLAEQRATFEGQYGQEWEQLQREQERRRLTRLYWNDRDHALDPMKAIQHRDKEPALRFDEALARFVPKPPR